MISLMNRQLARRLSKIRFFNPIVIIKHRTNDCRISQNIAQRESPMMKD